MAVTKITKIKKTLGKAIRYVINGEKTRDGELVSTYRCSLFTAEEEFEAVARGNCPETYYKRQYFREGRDIKAYHVIQAFSKEDDITPEKAHEIGMKYAKELTGGAHQFILSTHIDKGHIHNHIIFNATNMETFRKFHLDQKKMHEREILSDRLCKEYGLSVIEKKSGTKGRGNYEYGKHQKGESWKDRLRDTIDRVIPEAEDFEDFLMRMELEEGYEIKLGKYISFRYTDGQERFTRSKRLGDRYTEAAISYRIAHKDEEISKKEKGRPDPNSLPDIKPRIYLIAPLEKRIIYLKEQQKLSQHYENKVLIDEINALVGSFNYLKEHGLLYDDQFLGRYEEAGRELSRREKQNDDLSEKLTVLNTRLHQLKRYERSREDALRMKRNPNGVYDEEAYRHRVLYESASQYFRKNRIDPRKLNEKELRDEIGTLDHTVEETFKEITALKEERKKLFVISQNLSKEIGIPLIEPFQKAQEGSQSEEPTSNLPPTNEGPKRPHKRPERP